MLKENRTSYEQNPDKILGKQWKNQVKLDKTTKLDICEALCDLVPFVQFKTVKNNLGGVLVLVKFYQNASTE